MAIQKQTARSLSDKSLKAAYELYRRMEKRTDVSVKPELCRIYPKTRKHAMDNGCKGFDP